MAETHARKPRTKRKSKPAAKPRRRKVLPEMTIGIEEEYLLVDPQTGDLVAEPPDSVLKECEERLEGLARPEFLKTQIEVGTPVCQSIAEARKELARLRRTVADIAGKAGLALIAASTHPFAHWSSQVTTDKDRYNVLANDLQGVARRLLICGMHVHIGVDDDELRVELMNQVAYFLPHLLALSTSSPFWRGEDTGLKSYRLCVFDEMPRTGLPEKFDSFGEYMRHVDMLVKIGEIEDSSMLWWDVRPSFRFPTLEMRITDVCPLLDDAVCITALYACIIHMLTRLRRSNQRWRSYANMLVAENRWRAHRYGVDEGLIDFGKQEIVPLKDLMEELLDLIAIDARALDCEKEVKHVFTILKRGTSAHRQLKTFDAAKSKGKSNDEAFKAVVDQLIEETVTGI